MDPSFMIELESKLKKRGSIPDSVSTEDKIIESTAESDNDDANPKIIHSETETIENKSEETELNQNIKNKESETKNSNIQKLETEEDKKSVTEAQVNYGLLYKLFKLCCHNNTAIFMFIQFSLMLNTSDAFSDLALSFFLYTRYFVTGFYWFPHGNLHSISLSGDSLKKR